VQASLGIAAIKQENHFYPFGMALGGQSWRNSTQTTKNDYLYNGKSQQSGDPDFSRENSRTSWGWIGMIMGRGFMMRKSEGGIVPILLNSSIVLMFTEPIILLL
jgi:hypothetical protein